ncbi:MULTISPECIES: hypothetical protein [unclassified Aureimonas]|uniref:hypothetical protein n=1 Tax=unclassified Aureimonas TaxID=2615206 RepID=UPI0006F8B906|nr:MULTISPECIES: hypothetical protein [unclassified Aureimonas]KQT52179.1 hypothetical protein ASG62_16100 [Aureimonas sp. Leaf427]KQT70588.1 hypothetical protein ASG54_21850 [Aureimonas sp. Leaf460]
MARVQSVRFVAYTSPEAPEHLRWYGEILLQPASTAGNPNPREQAFNMRFWSKSKAHALARAEAWWTERQAEIAAAKVASAERAERRRKVAA